jgi:hypothetical protein
LPANLYAAIRLDRRILFSPPIHAKPEKNNMLAPGMGTGEGAGVIAGNGALIAVNVRVPSTYTPPKPAFVS